MCANILGRRSFASVLAAGYSGLIGRQFLPMLFPDSHLDSDAHEYPQQLATFRCC